MLVRLKGDNLYEVQISDASGALDPTRPVLSFVEGVVRKPINMVVWFSVDVIHEFEFCSSRHKLFILELQQWRETFGDG